MQARRRITSSESDETNLTTIVVGDSGDDSSSYNNYSTTTSTYPENDTENKYSKGGWNLRSFTNRVVITSGNALKALLPLTQIQNQSLTFTSNSSSFTDDLLQKNREEREPLITNGTLVDDTNSDYLEEFSKENVVVMTSRDRTAEFANAIRSLQARNISRAVNIRDPRKAKQVQSYSEFMMISKYIGKNIASTYAKLEKLTLLAKRKSLFDDRPQEIQELTYIIKGDLNALNQQIARLQEISKEQRRTTGGKHLLSHSSNMVLALQSKLANMSTDFKQILEVRTENLNQQKFRRDQFSQGATSSGVSPASKQGSLLLSEENQQVAIDMTSHPGGGALIPVSQTQQMLMYDESDNYLQQRAETMQNIESTIVELGGIFQQLAHMVKEQEEIVERIDTNIQDAEINIDAAHGEILKYFQSVTKNRWLMIKIFGVLILFFIFFVVFMA